MRNPTPLAPGEPGFDVTVYLVLNDFGRLGRAYVETERPARTRPPSLRFAAVAGRCVQHR